MAGEAMLHGSLCSGLSAKGSSVPVEAILLARTRQCSPGEAATLIFLTICTLVPAEYVHSVAHDDNECDEVRSLANKTWHAMKRTTKAGQRRSVSGQPQVCRRGLAMLCLLCRPACTLGCSPCLA